MRGRLGLFWGFKSKSVIEIVFIYLDLVFVSLVYRVIYTLLGRDFWSYSFLGVRNLESENGILGREGMGMRGRRFT